MRHDSLAGEAERQNDLLKADELQRDVRHRRQDAGDRDRKLQSFVAVAAKHKIGGGDVAMFVRDRPQPRQRQVQERIDNNRIGHGEEPVCANGEDDRGNRNDGIGGVEIAPEQEPGDPTAKASASETPLVNVPEIGRFPARRDEAQHRHQSQKRTRRRRWRRRSRDRTCSVLTNPVRSKNCEGGDRNKDQLEPEKERNAEKDGRSRVVERDPERQDTGDNQKNQLHASPGSANARSSSHGSDVLASLYRNSRAQSIGPFLFEASGTESSHRRLPAAAFAMLVGMVTSRR